MTVKLVIITQWQCSWQGHGNVPCVVADYSSKISIDNSYDGEPLNSIASKVEQTEKKLSAGNLYHVLVTERRFEQTNSIRRYEYPA